MAKRRKVDHSEKLSQFIVKGMQEKKAGDIVVMDLRKVRNAVADFFVICSGNSDKQLDAIADSIDDEVYKGLKESPWHTEGKNNKEWMLLDYTNVVAHIFKRERRSFYSLEKLWGDAEISEIEDEGTK
jgi:ribosome-associated protein